MRQNSYNATDAFNRYKSAWAEDQFKGALRTLLNLENAYNRNFRLASNVNGGPAKSFASDNSPVDTLNIIFGHAGLPVRIKLSGLGLEAEKHGSTYSIEALSDGERAALFIAAAVIIQEAHSVLLIDEPEKHLHPSISAILLEAALRVRPDIAVVVSSHDVSLIEKLNVQSTIYVKESVVTQTRPESRIFDVELLSAGEIPEQLRVDVLGARSLLLYVEGNNLSRDAAIYAHVYKDWKILSKGSGEKVIESARALRGAAGFVWLQAAGLVDGDGRDVSERRKLFSQGILVLPVDTIENLFFLRAARECFVEADLQMRGGSSFKEREVTLQEALSKVIPLERDQIVARRTLWRAQRAISSHPLSVKDIRDNQIKRIDVDVEAIKVQVEQETDKLIASGKYRHILARLPIKNIDIPDVSARTLGAASFKQYSEVIQRQLDLKTPAGTKFAKTLKRVLPKLHALPRVSFPVVTQPGARTVGIPVAPPNVLQPPILS